MTVPQGGINWGTWSLADFLKAAAAMTPQELEAQLRDLRQALGFKYSVSPAIVAGSLSGPDPAGSPITGNPVLVAGSFGGSVRALNVDTSGKLLGVVTAQGADDLVIARSMICDRAGILAVAPPVSKLVVAGNTVAGANTATATLAAPAAGLRNVVLAATLTLACGANAIAANAVAGMTGVQGGAIAFATACPVNDMRVLNIEGPIIGAAATAIVFSSPVGVVGASLAVQLFGYVAAFP